MFIIDFVMANYIWFLVASIIIILAIIGSYAEKSNFGLDEQQVEEKKQINKSDFQDKKMSDFVDISVKEAQKENVSNENLNSLATNNLNNTVILLNNGNNNSSNIDVESTLKNIDDTNTQVIKLSNNKALEKINAVTKANKEIEAFLPKKNIIDTEILDDIDSLSFDDLDIKEKLFDKESYYKYTDAIKFDDLKLPDIKPLNDTKEDIWKN